MIRTFVFLLMSAMVFPQTVQPRDERLQKLMDADKARIAKRPALTDEQKKESFTPKKMKKPKPFKFGVVSTSPEFRFTECRAELVKSLICIDPVDMGVRNVDTAAVESTAAGSEQELKFVSSVVNSKDIKEAGISGICIIVKAEGKFTPGTCIYPHQSSYTIPYCVVPLTCPTKVLLHEIGHMMGLSHHGDFNCVMYTGTEFCPVCLYSTGSLNYYDDKIDEMPVRVSLKKGECFVVPMVADGSETLALIFHDSALVIVHKAGQTFQEFFTVDGKSSDRLTPYSMRALLPKKPGSHYVFVTDVFIEKDSCYFTLSEDSPLTDLEEYLLSRRGILIDTSNE